MPKIINFLSVIAMGKDCNWKYTEDPKHLGRCEFHGVEDERSTYIGKSVMTFYGKSQNPVKYINM